MKKKKHSIQESPPVGNCKRHTGPGITCPGRGGGGTSDPGTRGWGTPRKDLVPDQKLETAVPLGGLTRTCESSTVPSY